MHFVRELELNGENKCANKQLNQMQSCDADRFTIMVIIWLVMQSSEKWICESKVASSNPPADIKMWVEKVEQTHPPSPLFDTLWARQQSP